MKHLVFTLLVIPLLGYTVTANCETFSQIEALYKTYDCDKQKEHPHPKCLNLVKQYNEQKQIEDKRLVLAEQCKKDSYVNCYEGVPWGESVDSLGPMSGFLKEYLINNISSCDPILKNNFKESDDWEHYEMSVKPSPFYALSLYGLLVGHYKEWKTLTEDDKYLLLSKLKKKYGKIQSQKCMGMELYNWKQDKNFDILLYLIDKKMITGNSEDKGSYDVLVRYINTKTFAVIIEALKEQLSNNQKKQQAGKDEKTLKIGDDL